jgi:ubiquinone/menaquinone biosynthesis C-methylase UbiE
LTPVSKWPEDWLKWLLFELGASYYARKLAAGPEADLRREFAEFLACSAGERVLDVGCGPGHLARHLARQGCQVTGVDRGWRLLRIARRWAAKEGIAVDFQRAAGERLPFAGGSFDCSYATTVIYWVRRPEAVLHEMARVTRPGGAVATLDPHASMSLASMREYCLAQKVDAQGTRKLLAWARAAELSRRFREDELRRLLESAGLATVQMERRLGGLVWFARGLVTVKVADNEN